MEDINWCICVFQYTHKFNYSYRYECNIFQINHYLLKANTVIKPSHTAIEEYVIDAVRRKRIEKGISQKELAFMLDLSIGFIGDVESTKSRAKYNLNHINKLA